MLDLDVLEAAVRNLAVARLSANELLIFVVHFDDVNVTLCVRDLSIVILYTLVLENFETKFV